uniref:Alternative protein EGFR n=1 Tax=Homo sapiens TaxID=9606 RepID=L0R6G1_HUMAN|nr:alternative protein EGFR [Homo sapiens]
MCATCAIQTAPTGPNKSSLSDFSLPLKLHFLSTISISPFASNKVLTLFI